MHSGYTFRTRAILKAQTELGWDVRGVTGLRHTAEGPDVEEADGLTFHRTRASTMSIPVWREWSEIVAFAERIDALCDQFQPDVLHAHSPVLDAIAGLRVAKKRNLPFVYEIRAFWEDAAVGNGTGTEGSARYRLTKALESWAVRRADEIVVICEGLKSDLISRGIDPGRITVSPNGVDLDLFGSPLPRDTALAADLGLSDADTVGFIGSFYDYEGLDDLIAAMPQLIAARPNAALLLVGGGPMEATLRAQAAASPVADRIHFVGRVPHQEVDRYYSLIDVLAYPRKKMRLTDLVTPLKPLEAMAQGKLVAASDVGGHRELIEDGVTGALFAADSPSAIADALAGLFESRQNWDERRATARAFVEKERNWASNIRRYESVYHRIANGAWK